MSRTETPLPASERDTTQRTVRLNIMLQFSADVGVPADINEYEFVEKLIYAVGQSDPNNPHFVDQRAVAAYLLSEQSPVHFDGIDMVIDGDEDLPDDDDDDLEEPHV